MSYEPRKKLQSVWIDNTTQYSTLTTLVDYTGDGILKFANVYCSNAESGQMELKITIDGTVILDITGSPNNGASCLLSTSRSGGSNYGVGVSLADNIYFIGGVDNTNKMFGMVDIPFATSLKVEIKNSSGNAKYNKIMYSKYV